MPFSAPCGGHRHAGSLHRICRAQRDGRHTLASNVIASHSDARQSASRSSARFCRRSPRKGSRSSLTSPSPCLGLLKGACGRAAEDRHGRTARTAGAETAAASPSPSLRLGFNPQAHAARSIGRMPPIFSAALDDIALLSMLASMPVAPEEPCAMIAPDLETGVDRLRELVEQAAVVVPFTGAGISTECGIPDFRSPGGIWTKMRPIDFGDFLASREMRDESWRRRFAMEEQFGGAKPGRGHRALASPLPVRQDSGRHHPEYRQSASGLRVCGATTWSSCTATRPTRPAWTAPNATNCRG